MADYKELLRRAVEALPENNGAARRAVYEKARAALVGQLRAINPPLPARDITTHRLQLEDCIRQVEQEASEAALAGMSAAPAEQGPAPVYFEASPDRTQPAKPQIAASNKPAPAPEEKPSKGLPAGGTIEDIIAAAEAESPDAAPKAEPKPEKSIRLAASTPEPEIQDGAAEGPAPKVSGRQLPSIVARAEAAKGRSLSTSFGTSGGDASRRGPAIEPRPAAPSLAPAARGGSQAATARQLVEPVTEPKVAAAMSAVREVDVEAEPATADAQGAIDRAIATLDREARGETTPDLVPDPVGAAPAVDDEDEVPSGKAKRFGLLAGGRGKAKQAQQPQWPAKQGRRGRENLMPAARRGNLDSGLENGFPRARPETDSGGMSAISIFLVVFAVLIAGAGGAAYWAVSQGYLDPAKMFSAGAPPAEAAVPEEPAAAPAVAAAVPEVTEPATGPGNTAPADTPQPATELAATEERLTPEPALTGSEPLALTAVATEEPAAPSEDRLPTADAAETAEAAVAALDPVNIEGSQSLLLEASDSGTTGAVPFSGTVEWSKGTDETGQPTLVGKANIPARNLGVDLLIRKNSDPTLPASHLMEVNFQVTDTFIGGSVAGLPGVLLKNEELVQGTPLVGASARVVGNSFLFALSAQPEDLTNNTSLLTSRKWIDLALIYATGKRAIITLEKDSAAEDLFNEVFTAWSQTASAAEQ